VGGQCELRERGYKQRYGERTGGYFHQDTGPLHPGFVQL
jgi:hypothetical protein